MKALHALWLSQSGQVALKTLSISRSANVPCIHPRNPSAAKSKSPPSIPLLVRCREVATVRGGNLSCLPRANTRSRAGQMSTDLIYHYLQPINFSRRKLFHFNQERRCATLWTISTQSYRTLGLLGRLEVTSISDPSYKVTPIVHVVRCLFRNCLWTFGQRYLALEALLPCCQRLDAHERVQNLVPETASRRWPWEVARFLDCLATWMPDYPALAFYCS